MIVPGTGRCVNGDTEYESERTHEKDTLSERTVNFWANLTVLPVEAAGKGAPGPSGGTEGLVPPGALALEDCPHEAVVEGVHVRGPVAHHPGRVPQRRG